MTCSTRDRRLKRSILPNRFILPACFGRPGGGVHSVCCIGAGSLTGWPQPAGALGASGSLYAGCSGSKALGGVSKGDGIGDISVLASVDSSGSRSHADPPEVPPNDGAGGSGILLNRQMAKAAAHQRSARRSFLRRTFPCEFQPRKRTSSSRGPAFPAYREDRRSSHGREYPPNLQPLS